MLREFTEQTWIVEPGGIYRIDTNLDSFDKMLIQVFKDLEDGYVLVNETDCAIMQKNNTITIATKAPFRGYLIAK
ncbi:hypothetical protein U9K52_08405 [Chryseobacterium sp. MHB01]|uniref:hypothetical protein n=1 Tax=Chryseobacterium sp. MHB01 TaxID=3109433 RepID=UPI002AFE7C0A|nr:hypothetical protein [Chryseobacterium sp. MHB01]MEA1848929.1 hypothetical protein [Chryseobacterium sp. MHB01]